MLIPLRIDFGPCTGDDDVAGLQALVRRLGRPRVVEVGSWLGRTALAMLEAGAAEVHCVDTWTGTQDPADETFALGREHGHESLLRGFCRNVYPHLGERIFPYVGDGSFWADCWAFPPDLVFLDADHSAEGTLEAIRSWQPLLKHGGILCGHDFSDPWPGVKQAVEQTGPFEVVGSTVWWRQL